MKMQDKRNRQIAATDKQIDELVYELYGLTKDEIRVVEGADAVGIMGTTTVFQSARVRQDRRQENNEFRIVNAEKRKRRMADDHQINAECE